MPSTSHLRHSSTFAPIQAPTTQTIHPSKLAPPSKKRKMTVTQTYFLAHTARGKLSHEAARGDHDLRLLVGHANLLDALTIELQEAEREQDAWFEKTVAESRKPAEPRRVQFTDEVAQKVEDLEIPDASDDEDSEADSEDSSDADMYADATIPSIPAQMSQRLASRSRSPPPAAADESDEEDLYDDMDMDNEDLALARVASHSASPPELIHEDSDESDDDMSGPDSPPATSDARASFVLPQDIKTKDFAAVAAKPAIHTEDHPMMQAVY